MLKRLRPLIKQPAHSSRTILRVHQSKNGLKGSFLKFWTSNTKIMLADVQQKAVISFFVMQYIMDFNPSMYLKDPRSIRERLVDRQQFEKYVLWKSNIVKKDVHLKKMEQLGLESKNIDEVLAGFEIEKGMIYNPTTFSQKRMSRVCTTSTGIKVKRVQLLKETPNQETNNQKAIANSQIQTNHNQSKEISSHITSKISPKIYQDINIYIKHQKIVLNPMIHSGITMKQLFSLQSRVISGDKGIGKSFTFLLYSYLASFVLEAKLQQKYYHLYTGFYKQLFQTFETFHKVQKLFYIAVRDITSYGKFEFLMRYQVNQQCFKSKQESLKSMTPFECKEQYRKQNINSFIVFDEINSFYTDSKVYFINQYKGINQAILLKRLITKSSAISSVINSKVILNSSQDLDTKKLQYKLNNFNLLNVYEHQDTDKFNIKIDYSSFFLTQEGLIQLYGTFWFEITRILTKKGIAQKIIREKRYLFQMAFNLSSSSQLSIVPWKNLIFPLDLRQALSSSKQQQKNHRNKPEFQILKFPEQIDLSKLGQHFTENRSQQQIIDQLHHIKGQVQKFKLKLLQNTLKIFLNCFKDNTDRLIRLAIILQMRSQAYSNKLVGVSNFQIRLNTIYSLKIGKIKPTQQQRYETITPLYQYIDLLLSQLKIGTIDRNNNSMKMAFSRTIFLEESQFILKDITLMQEAYEIVIKHNKSCISLAQIMGNIFKRGFIYFNYECYYQCQSSSSVTHQQRREIIKQPNFSNENNLKHCLQQVFKDCRSNSCSDSICIVPSGQNKEGFDLMLLKYNGINRIFQLITIDTTVGSIQEKLTQKSFNSSLEANQCHLYLDLFFRSVFNTKEVQIMNQIKEKINKIKLLQPKLSHYSLTKITLEIHDIISIKTHIYKQNFEQQTQLTIKSLQNWQRYAQGVAFAHQQAILLKIAEKQSKQENLKPNSTNFNKLFISIQSQQFQQICALVKLVKILHKSQFRTYENLIQFIQRSCKYQQNISHHIIPQQLYGNERNKQNYFSTLFNFLKEYSQPQGLQWIHYIAAPSFRVQQYLNNYKNDTQEIIQKDLSQVKKDTFRPFLYKFYAQSYGRKIRSLSCSLMQLKFDNKMIEMIQYKDKDENISTIKKQYNFLQNLTEHLSRQKSKK